MDNSTASNTGWDISSVATIHWPAASGKELIDATISINFSKHVSLVNSFDAVQGHLIAWSHASVNT